MSSSSCNLPVIEIFDSFRQDLDDHADRRERLIKASRDVTNLSKRVIFLLHRIVLEESSDDYQLAQRAAKSGHEKLRDVQDLFAGMRHELQGDRFWRYQRQVSPGLQEYIEALSFAHFLQHGTLVTFDEVQASISDSDGVPYFPLTTSDYLLGLSDLTGELMRFAISNISRRGGQAKANKVCAFVRECKSDFERLTPYVRDLSKKQSVTGSSLQKIEDAAYAIAVRGSEFNLSPEDLDAIVAESLSTYQSAVYRDREPYDHADENMDI